MSSDHIKEFLKLFWRMLKEQPEAVYLSPLYFWSPKSAFVEAWYKERQRFLEDTEYQNVILAHLEIDDGDGSPFTESPRKAFITKVDELPRACGNCMAYDDLREEIKLESPFSDAGKAFYALLGGQDPDTSNITGTYPRFPTAYVTEITLPDRVLNRGKFVNPDELEVLSIQQLLEIYVLQRYVAQKVRCSRMPPVKKCREALIGWGEQEISGQARPKPGEFREGPCQKLTHDDVLSGRGFTQPEEPDLGQRLLTEVRERVWAQKAQAFDKKLHFAVLGYLHEWPWYLFPLREHPIRTFLGGAVAMLPSPE